MDRAHWHAQVEVNFVTRGAVHYLMHDHAVTLSRGSLCLFWGGLPHRVVDTSDDADFVAIHLPLVHFFRLRLPKQVRRELMHGATLTITAGDGADHANFPRWANYMQSGDRDRCDHAINELLLRIERIRFEPFALEPAADCTAGRPPPMDQAAFRNIGRLCSFIGENFRDDIHSADIASSADIHPKYAMSVFKKSTGMTLNEYVNLLRLSYAQALLMNGDANVLQVAMESGFGSLSAFNSSFRKISGMSPSVFRRDCRVRLPADDGASASAPATVRPA
jgi:AraC-like DNA-binding protein